MNSPAFVLSSPRSKALPAILTSGVIAGVLDITYVIAWVYLIGGNPARMLQGIAYSILGPAAYEGGYGTAALGLGLHFCVALSVAAVFYALTRKFTFLIRRPYVWGPLYGAGVHLTMNLVVLPLTLIPWKGFPPPAFWMGMIPHLVCVGLPIALVVRRYTR